MTINISIPDVGSNLHPQITVLGVGGSGGNAVNNMMNSNLEGVDFLIANTDAQALQISNCKKKIQLGVKSTRGLGAGMRPDIGKQAAEEALDEISEKLEDSHMLFIAAGMGGGTGTGAAPVIAKLAREKGILTVGVVTKPFHFEGTQRMKLADKGLEELQQYVDTLLTIPNQNLFRIANEKTTFADAFKMADDVLYAGVRGVTDLMIQPGLINLDFSDIKTVMSEMGKAMMGTGEASGDGRAVAAAEAAIANPLIDDVSLKGARGLIINITGGQDITLYEVDEAANRIKQEVDDQANIIYGTTCDERLEGVVRVSIVATGIDASSLISQKPVEAHSSISINNSVYQQKPIEENEISLDSYSEVYSKTEVSSEKNELIEDSKKIDVENNSLDDQNFINNNIENTEEEEMTNNEVKESEIEHLQSDMHNNKLVNKEFSNNLQGNSDIISNEEDEEVSDTTEISEEAETKTSVRKLSLFDHLDDESTRENTEITPEESRSEPVFESQIEHDQNNAPDSLENEVKSENIGDEVESENTGVEDEFNQENEEELLDIPTFLRRQAN